MHTATLQNVCLLDRRTFLLVQSPSAVGTGGGEALKVIDAATRAHLEHTYAGFAGLGQDGTGFSFQEVSYTSLMGMRKGGSAGGSVDVPVLSSAVWSQATTVFASAAVAGNIFHAAQSAMAMAHAAYNPAVFPWVSQMARLVVTSLQRADLAWSLGLQKAVLSVLLESREHTSYVPVHGMDDVVRALDSSPHLVCFRDVVLVGNTELAAPFLGSIDEADRFRSSVYSHLDLLVTGDDSYDGVGVGTYKAASTAGHVNDRDWNGEDYLPPLARTDDGRRFKEARPNEGLNEGPNDAVRVTVLVRGAGRGREVVNMARLLTLLRATAAVNERWLDTHVLQFDRLSFRAQVGVLRQTDVFIAAHGSGLQNLIFLNSHSAVIELFTSPWYEPGYQPTALTMGVHYYVLPQTDMERTRNCEVPQRCLDSPLLVQRRSLACLAIRTCDAVVDEGGFESLFWLATQAVRFTKRDLLHWRYTSAQECCHPGSGPQWTAGHTLRPAGEEWAQTQAQGQGQGGSDCNHHCFYRKGYLPFEHV
jgi:hypothetical protein